MHPVYEANQAAEGRSSLIFRRSKAAALVVTLIATLGLTACGDKKADQQQAAQGQQKPPEVGVVTVAVQNVPIVSDLPGRLEPSRIAEVRARAAGIVQKRLFKEGSDVKAGQALFQIDSTPYRANLQSAQATLAQAEANLAQAASTSRRYKPLVEANAISKQEYDVAVASEKAAAAQVAAGKAAVTNANVSLGYASVTAPISGRIGRALVTEGALVGQGDATKLAVIQQINPMYVNITQSSSEILRMREALAQGKVSSDGQAGARVSVYTDDGRKMPQEGRLLFTDLTVDETTGQVQVRAEIPNADGMLLPGMYVRVRLEQAQIDNAVVLPQQSVTRNEKGNFVMVVADDGSVSPRPVQIGQSQGTNWVVTSGLKPGEKVMVDGLVKVGMGAKKVTPVPWTGTSQPKQAQQPQQSASGAQAPASAASAPAAAASPAK
ncbi:efflux RND transporter periplasmic adaptor subunit [Diaphorobacter aerolatus]|uniref:Efflux RND transporter periplasmic adaptor subunit n=1 Tax=Diaphorobacter aerolatus TaxID=1288495 RepID=A0A7H0GPW7_9BURK|nr:efflux RND transporter periplasmic adaptor subunit [Diaphorobacter aerolatus]QNP50333.1 efflux RND transporter periplasmic adaptor subunit [Diaphorobacter aerolatus]